MPPGVDGLAARCAALQAVLPGDAAFIGPTAALLLGFPLPRRLESDPTLVVSTSHLHRAPRHRGAVGHRRPPHWRVDELAGLRIVGHAETWLSLAAHLVPADLTAVADFLLGPDGPREPQIMRSRMLAAMDAAGAARGIRALRSALADAREGVRSRPETHLRLLIREVGPREPDVAVTVPVDGDMVVHPDLSWPEYRVAVEYDGAGHRSARQHAVDVARHEVLVDQGWSVTHVVARDLYARPSSVVAMVLRRLRAAGWDGARAGVGAGTRTELTRFGRFEL